MSQRIYLPAAELLMVTCFLSSFYVGCDSLAQQIQSILTDTRALQSCSVYTTNTFYARREEDLLR